MKNRGYIIPIPIDPEETVCIRVRVPNHQLYIAAFMRAYAYFGKYFAWNQSVPGSADAAAAVWQSAIDTTLAEWNTSDGLCEECEDMDIRQKTGFPCIIEKLSGEEWIDAVDMKLCVPRMRIKNGVIQQDTTGNGDWVDSVDVETEAYDPRFDNPIVPAWENPPVGETGECLSAANVSEYVSFATTYLAGSMVDGLSFFQVLSAAITILAAIIELVPLAIMTAGITQVYTLVIDNWTGVRDFDITDKLIEFLQCRYETDGSMSEANWIEVKADIADWRATLASNNQKAKWQMAYILIDLWGPVGMTALGNIWGIDTYECPDGCDNFLEYDFSAGSELGWSMAQPAQSTLWNGAGWGDAYPTKAQDGVVIQSPILPNVNLYRVVMYVTEPVTGGSPYFQINAPPLTARYWVYRDGSPDNMVSFNFAAITPDGVDDRIGIQLDGQQGGLHHFEAILWKIRLYYTEV